MKIMILGAFDDAQTGVYLLESFQKYSSDVSGVDIRRIVNEVQPEETQKTILKEIDALGVNPDLIVVMKGLELTPTTVDKIREMFPKAKIINWMFDKYIAGVPAWENPYYIEAIKKYDYFFCSLKGVAKELRAIGLDNCFYLPEACYHPYNGETYMNYYMKQKYSEDLSFVGSLGYFTLHKNRIPILNKIATEGFRLKIWGPVVCEWKLIPRELRECHTMENAVNEKHSKVCQSSLINLGIDQDPELELSQSARMYRVMCSGGLYLTTYVKGLETMFNINKDGHPPTEDNDLVVYYSIDHLIDVLDYLLERDELREKIRRNGQKKVLEHHTFEKRCGELIDMVKSGKIKDWGENDASS